jgi:ribonuclease R
VVRPPGRSAAPVVQIDDPTARNARPGDLVVIEPLPHTLHHEVVRGVILERLGRPNETEAMLRGIIRRHGIPEEFPAEAREAAIAAASRFEPDALESREDLRELLTITIDPPDARDFDDAISIEPLEGGRVRLGVHIADVSNFVRPDDPLDLAASERGNSVYLPRMVVPMLPEVLSNGVCSLQPAQPRLTKSAFITYDRRAKVLERRFCNSLIRSHARLTYPQASSALEGDTKGLDEDVVELLKRADALAKRIRARRLANGMLVLTLPEVEITLDDDGNVADAGPADTSFSHTIIEMFMVEANEAVSRMLREAGLAHLRRIHPPPAEESADRVRRLASLLGLELPDTLSRKALQELLNVVRGRPEEPAINYVLLRTLAQAFYAPSDEGHFALASEDYCHFTSPIRRYPDLVVHRVLDAWLARKRAPSASPDAPKPPSELELASIGRRTSATERRAQTAERDAKGVLLLQLMRSKLGQVFEGIVSGVAAFGAFVTIRPHLAEGLIAIGDLGDDRWEFNEEWGILVGRRSNRFISIGQTVRVIAASIDDVRQELNFVPADKAPIGRPVRPHHAIIGALSPRANSRARSKAPNKQARERRAKRHPRDIEKKRRSRRRG